MIDCSCHFPIAYIKILTINLKNMKQLKFSILLLLAAGLSLNSCKKDDKKTTKIATSEEVAKYKTDIEHAGINLVNELDVLSKTEAVSVLLVFQNLPSDKPNVPFAAILSKNTKLMASTLKQSAESTAEMFEEETGIYTWNAKTSDWDKTVATGKIVYKFPATENGTVNNAEMAISEMKTAQNTLAETDMPTSIVAYIKVDGKEVAGYSFNALYDTEGFPTSISTALVIESFKMNATLSYSKSEVVEKFSFVNGKSNVFTWNTTLKGDFTMENIGAVMNMIASQDSDENEGQMSMDGSMTAGTGTGSVDESNQSMSMSAIGNLLSTLKTNYQIFDINMSFNLNAKAFIDALDKIEKSNASEAIKEEQEVAEFNKNMTGILEFENGTRIATAEMTMLDDDLSMDLIFADNSRVAMDVYMENSMKDFSETMEKFLENLQQSLN